MKSIQDLNTKIIATVGPSSQSYEMLLALVEAGVDLFRINFSHGTHADHLKVINHIAYINKKYNLHIGILADLQGPKIRIGEVENGSIELNQDDEISFTSEAVIGNNQRVHMSYSNFAKDVKVGESVLIDDGKNGAYSY